MYLRDARTLTEKEKKMKYKRNIRETNSICNKEKRKHVPLIEDQFRKEVITTEGPIGFPLCAHLYFFY